MPDSREYPPRPYIGVGGVTISDGRVLLIRRIHPPLEGQWSIPGGMLEVGETLTEGVKRELAEETRIEVRVLDLIEVFERIHRDDKNLTKYHFVVVDYFCEVVKGKAVASSDVSEVAWANLSELSTYSLTETATRVIMKGFQMAHERNGKP